MLHLLDWFQRWFNCSATLTAELFPGSHSQVDKPAFYQKKWLELTLLGKSSHHTSGGFDTHAPASHRYTWLFPWWQLPVVTGHTMHTQLITSNGYDQSWPVSPSSSRKDLHTHAFAQENSACFSLSCLVLRDKFAVPWHPSKHQYHSLGSRLSGHFHTQQPDPGWPGRARRGFFVQQYRQN